MHKFRVNIVHYMDALNQTSMLEDHGFSCDEGQIMTYTIEFSAHPIWGVVRENF